jgi:septal ring-binding cell division protein DamX/type II secretory pathway predicted ATPase ExeA
MNKKTPTFDESKSLFNPDFWFESEKLRATLDQLEHFTRFGDLLILLIGEPMSGKTSILERMQKRVTDSDLCVIKSHPLLSIQEVLRRMRAAFNLVLTPDQAEHSVEQMHDYLAASIPENNHRLVIIDDAEQLGKETLLELLKLVDIQRQRGESLVHFILAGEEPLLKSLRAIKRKKFPRAAYHRLKIHPLAIQDIPQLLAEANVQSKLIELTEEKSEKLHQFSNGNIGKIRLSLDNLAQGIEIGEAKKKKKLLSTKQKEKKRSELEQKIDTLYGDLEDDNAWLMPVVIVLSLIAFGAYWYLQYQPENNLIETAEPNQQRTIPALRPPTDRIKLERQLALEEKAIEQKNIEDESDTTSNLTNKPIDSPSEHKSENDALAINIETNATQELESAALDIDSDLENKLEFNEKLGPSSQNLTTGESNTSALDELDNVFLDTDKMTLVEETVIEPKANNIGEKISSNESKTEQALSRAATQDPQVPIEVPSDNSSNLKLGNDTGQAQQILAWPKSHYTIQLLVVSERKYFNRFESQYNVFDYFWFKSTRNGKEVFFVISGHYPTKELALSEAEKLVKKYPKLSTWVKPVQLIHQDILAFKKK